MLEFLANGHKKTPRGGGVILADGSKALGVRVQMAPVAATG
ncbi:hypothetical protein [Synechococcus sp. UW179B]|nr:hypothetical protein [Synechococcus sp. UW179B]